MSVAVAQGMAHSDVKGEGSSSSKAGEEDVGRAWRRVVGADPHGRYGHLQPGIPSSFCGLMLTRAFGTL